ncbi:uncharacterized protein RDI95_013392 [Morus bassanus]
MGTSSGCPRPHVPWLLASLLLVAGGRRAPVTKAWAGRCPRVPRVGAVGRNGGVCWGSPSSRLSLSWPGAVAAQPQQVNGVLGGSVLLSLALPPNKTVKEIEWSFSSSTGTTIQVAEFGPGGSFERPDPKDRFKDRLEMFNELALKIGALERGDSGVYGARIKLHPALVEDQSFSLSVYGPVQAPEIQHQLLSSSAHGCNVSLRCWVPDGSDAEPVWQLGSSLWVAQGELREDNQTLLLAVPAAAFNSCYTCMAQNPIQERNVSICLDTLCRQQGKIPPQHPVPAIPGGPGAHHGLSPQRSTAGGATLASLSSKDAPLEPQYAMVQMRTPPEADEWSWVPAQLDPFTPAGPFAFRLLLSPATTRRSAGAGRGRRGVAVRTCVRAPAAPGRKRKRVGACPEVCGRWRRFRFRRPCGGGSDGGGGSSEASGALPRIGTAPRAPSAAPPAGHALRTPPPPTQLPGGARGGGARRSTEEPSR